MEQLTETPKERSLGYSSAEMMGMKMETRMAVKKVKLMAHLTEKH